VKIAQIVASLESRRGSPCRSLRSLAQARSSLTDSVELLATDREPGQVQMGSLVARKFRRVWPESISRSPELDQHLRQTDFEVIHAHGLWLRPLHYARRSADRQNIPLVLSPRGMMSAWAPNHHRRRKAWADRLLHPGALEAVKGWHATSAGEAQEIQDLGFQQPICIAPNAVDIPTAVQSENAREHWMKRVPAAASRPVALFYSRFHNKKRVVELIDLWHRVASRDWLLLLVGIPDQLNVAQLEAYVIRQGAQKHISAYDGTAPPPPYAIAQLSILPTHSENFGLVVAESLANGVPPLVTDTTPWSELNGLGAGWCVPWSEFHQTLKLVLNESDAQKASRRQTGKEWIKTKFSWHDTANKLHDFYQNIR
jgi:glycosyltransferase involved in cell wall biosynthesis